MMRRFCGYLDKVFDFGDRVQALRDDRQRPRIPTSSIWTSAFAMFAMHRGSLNAIESELLIPKRLEGLVGRAKPSADRIGDVFCLIPSEELRAMLSGINHQLERNKVFDSGGPWRFVALDGHEFFRSRNRCCEACSQRTVKVHDREEIEYYHRGVVCHLIGFDLAAPLDVEMLRPGEGEIVAAKRLLERVLLHYGRFFDAVVGDALYFEAPFFNFCIDHRKHVVAVIKGDRRALLQDAQGVFSQMTPGLWDEPRRLTEFWDEGGFTSAEGVKARLRVLHAHETVTRRRRIAKQWLEEVEQHDWWWATTFSLSALSSRQLWMAGHRRWDVENDLFNTLSTYWALNHCFKHEPTAITNFLLTLFITFVLLQSFYLRNLKPERRYHLTLIGLGDELHLSLRLRILHAPWLDQGG